MVCVMVCVCVCVADHRLKTMNCREFNATEITTNTCAAYTVKVYDWLCAAVE
jgi:hypothetical protein